MTSTIGLATEANNRMSIRRVGKSLTNVGQHEANKDAKRNNKSNRNDARQKQRGEQVEHELPLLSAEKAPSAEPLEAQVESDLKVPPRCWGVDPGETMRLQ